MFLFVRGFVGDSSRVLMISTSRFRPTGAGRLSRAKRRAALRRGAGRASQLVQAAAISAPSFALAQSAAQGDPGLPSEVQHVGWTFVDTGSDDPPNGFFTGGNQNGIGAPTPGSQRSTWTINHSFDVYLDNGDGRPQGNYQVLTYNLAGEFTPNAGGGFFQMDNPFQIGFTDDKVVERAWWTGQLELSVEPIPGTGTDEELVWQANQPATPNEEEEYTSGNDFDLGFTASTEEGAGIDASYHISNEKTNKIPDWGVINNTVQNSLSWEFSSRNPCDTSGRKLDVNGQNGCFDQVGPGIRSGLPNRPNGLSLSQLQTNASGRWQTQAVLSGQDAELGFDVLTQTVLFDTYCDNWFVGFCGPNRVGNPHGILSGPTEHWLDVSAVNPIPIQSLNLSPNPANGGTAQNVTGTITLERAAPMDLTVLVYSNSQNAIVGAPLGSGPASRTDVRIPKGAKSATFTIQTNDNGIAAGGHTTAAISAFYTETTTSQLRVNAGS